MESDLSLAILEWTQKYKPQRLGIAVLCPVRKLGLLLRGGYSILRYLNHKVLTFENFSNCTTNTNASELMCLIQAIALYAVCGHVKRKIRLTVQEVT